MKRISLLVLLFFLLNFTLAWAQTWEGPPLPSWYPEDGQLPAWEGPPLPSWYPEDGQLPAWEGPPLPSWYPEDGQLPAWEGPPLPPGYSPDGQPPSTGTTGSGGGSRPDTIAGVLSLIINQILNPLIGVLIASALVVFFIGVIKYIRVAGEEDKNEAKRIMWWGIIALFVMVAVWGLVQIVINTFFPGGVPARPPIPRF